MGLYRQILENIPATAIVVDKKGQVRWSSAAFRKYFRSVKARGPLSSVCGDATEEFSALFRDALNTDALTRKVGAGETVFEVTVTHIGKYLLGIVRACETEIEREISSAQTIQQRLLPPAKGGNGVQYSFMYLPFREIGGDLPDIYEQGGETMSLLADVSGKGISAGMMSAFVKAGWDRSDPSPARALTGLNLKFQELNLDESSYVTAAAVRIERETHEIRYCVAGHNAPLLLKSSGGINEIAMRSPPVSNWIPDFKYGDKLIGYSSGDILVMLTDGVIESRNAGGEEFTIERVESVLQEALDAADFIERLKGALRDFCGKFTDDITAIAFDL